MNWDMLNKDDQNKVDSIIHENGEFEAMKEIAKFLSTDFPDTRKIYSERSPVVYEKNKKRYEDLSKEEQLDIKLLIVQKQTMQAIKKIKESLNMDLKDAHNAFYDIVQSFEKKKDS